VNLGDRDFSQVAPAAGVLEVEMPLLQHPLLGAGAAAPVPLVGAVLTGPGGALGQRVARPEIVPGGEQRPGPGQDDHAHLIVGLGRQHRVAELDQEAAILRVPGPGAVQRDPRDGPFVQ